MASTRTERVPSPRFGMAEWFGQPVLALSAEERRTLAQVPRKGFLCPFTEDMPGGSYECLKKSSGVCSIRRYEYGGTAGGGHALRGEGEPLVTVCPYRFLERRRVFQWIGTTILGHDDPQIINEVDFLERPGSADRRPVGEIDHILVHPDADELAWCALEMQSVYVSNSSWAKELAAIREHRGENLPFPCTSPRPDYRSSAPKRLMPQLEIKVPTLRRWGKKTCVVVDRSFFADMADMRETNDLSNSDIVWFVVDFAEDDGGIQLVEHSVHYTTLETAVEGLTAGQPVSLGTFEERIRQKLGRVSRWEAS